MKTETIVTLEDNSRYYLAEETVQNNIKYFLANKLDENDEPSDESVIFEEIIYEDGCNLEEVKDEKMLNFLAAIFTSNIITELDSEN